ncbi:MAG: hypothetical protein ACD_19C00182G0053 [uncultured bacterium]|nr:MAG: hypothetical protein ACD_19C00182G0053 [uncultured bacterium]
MNNIDWGVAYNTSFIIASFVGIILAGFALYTKRFAK